MHQHKMERNGINYSQTFENKSSAPLNPPAGLVEGIPMSVDVLAVVEEVTGAALVQPPKSSSAVTVVGCLDEVLAPQPAPMSLGVRVSGTFIMVEAEAVVSAGAGSGLFHALASNGSQFDESMFGGMAAVVVVGGSCLGAGASGAACCGAGFERLKAECNSC